MMFFLEQYGIVYVVAGLCGLEILVKAIVRHTYKRLIKAAKNIGKSKHKLMKSMRAKFETCYQLKIGVPNVSVFVEKQLRHYRILGIHICAWEAFCHLCMLLMVFASIGGGVYLLFAGAPRDVALISLCSGIIGNGIVLMFDCVFGIGDKRELLRVDMIDFFENIHKPRLENETFHSQMLTEYQQEYFDRDEQEAGSHEGKVVSMTPRDAEKGMELDVEFTEEEEAVLREVIHEYM